MGAAIDFHNYPTMKVVIGDHKSLYITSTPTFIILASELVVKELLIVTSMP